MVNCFSVTDEVYHYHIPLLSTVIKEESSDRRGDESRENQDDDEGDETPVHASFRFFWSRNVCQIQHLRGVDSILTAHAGETACTSEETAIDKKDLGICIVPSKPYRAAQGSN
jgi:hypothetical protein